VAQDIGPLLKTFPGYGELGLKSAPSQMCAWAFGDVGLRNYYSFPIDQASNVLRQIAPKAIGFVRHYFENEPPGSLVLATNTSELHWVDLPLLFPILASHSVSGRDYLILSLAELPRRIKPPPLDLFQQLKDRNDVLYYDWEITEARLHEWARLFQRIDMAHLRMMPPTNAPSPYWPYE